MSNLLLLLPLLSLGVIWLSGELFRAKQTHIVRSGAYPNRTNALNATHFIEILVTEPVTEVRIHIPSEISVEHVQLINRQFQTVPATVIRIDAGLLISLSLPVSPRTNLTVMLQGVRILNRSKRIWNYEIYAKHLNHESFKQIGIANLLIYSELNSHQRILS